MKRRHIVGALAGMLLAAGLTGVGWADIPSDSFTLTVTPAGDRGVIINTTTFDFGSVVLGQSTTTAAIPVTSTGSVGNIEYTVAGSNSANWTLSTDGTADAQNELEVRALFNSGVPGAFGAGTTHLVTTSAKDAGNLGGDADFEGNVDVDNMALLTTRDLYVRFVLPPTSTSSNQQSVTITVTAEAGE